MKAKMLKFKQILPKAISAFLVFWLSSILVLACCGWGFFVTPVSTLVVEEAISCPLGKGHECCDKNKKKSGEEYLSESQSNVDCCVFKPQKTLSSNINDSKDIKKSFVKEIKEKLSQPRTFIKQAFINQPFYKTELQSRQGLYRKNCVFRI